MVAQNGGALIETLREGVVVVGTAHISATSVEEVERTIRELRPKQVLVELDLLRLQALRDPEAWQKTDIFKVLREKKQHLFLLQLYLGAMQAQMGRETGVAPGSELLRAVEVAGEVGAEVVLIDRSITVTLKRGFGAMGFWAKTRLAWHVLKQLLPNDRPAETIDVEEMLKSDAITRMTEEFARYAPEVKVALIDERDAFMASYIEEASRKGSLVAVVGAGHLPGIRNHVTVPESIPPRAPLLEVPKRRITVGKVLFLAVPLALSVVVAYLVLHGNWDQLRQSFLLWVGLHFALAALGAALALGHPLAVLTGAVAAPFTSVLSIRGVSSGMLAGLVQAKVKPPVVADFHAVKHLETARQFWSNRVVRVLTVASLTTFGSLAASGVFFFLLARHIGGP